MFKEERGFLFPENSTWIGKNCIFHVHYVSGNTHDLYPHMIMACWTDEIEADPDLFS